MNKKIFLAGLLCLASVASVVGMVGNAHKVEAANIAEGTHVYFELPSSWGTGKNVNILLGHDTYSIGYQMTKLGNTDVYYVNLPKWDGYTQYGFIYVNETVWGSEYNSPKNRLQWAPYKTDVIYASGLPLNSGKYMIFGGFHKSGDTLYNEKLNNFSELNYAVTAVAENGGTATVSGNELTAAGTLTAKNDLSTVNVLKYTDATLKATPSAGYEFEGWYNGAEKVSSDATFVVNDIYEARTYTAKFTNLAVKEVNALFAKYYGEGSYTKDSVLNTSKIADNEVAKYFHASADTKYRRTVYTTSGLTMTTSTDGNTYADASTYSNGDNCVTHTGFGGNFTVNEYSSVEDWFITLHDFVANSGEGWTKEGNVYSHDLVLTTADKEDELTRMAREFVAPMWLAPNAENFAYAQFTKLTVEEVGETLVMKLYVDNRDILVQDSNNVFSQVTIY